MKHISLILLAAILLSASCKKKYSCYCIYKVNNKDTLIDAGDIYKSKNGALHECSTIREQQYINAGHPDAVCAVPL